MVDYIEDGFGNVWSKYCSCGALNEIVRPGKVQCSESCEYWRGWINPPDIDEEDYYE